ncbi:M48 family metallopeptidase [Flavihumibacter sp. ZG627]|uniref:M48 family metallopeptidase n=1 Tax=Flavihumibacter sp. ZG627 TaxID=1463156 RepID=UPI00057CA83D|nr:SprT family zinc-dependent metalloprotease [Flavihumibacter sp. ZG627]KIC92600.1 metal-dependent hydrolase [Flavihumibacter sp. ZG627]
MRSVRYGSRLIQYSIQPREGLKSHYISVERHSGVVLKGKHVSDTAADKMILKKAKWILDKLDVVGTVNEGDIVTGSRLPYLGKTYYVQILVDRKIETPLVQFNYSRFTITVKSLDGNQKEIQLALQKFYKEKATEKIIPRVEKLTSKTGLRCHGVQLRKMTRRWGSCTARNKILLNTDAIKLPFSLIDYLIIHELVHTKVKDHSKLFWKELSKHVRNWKTLDEKMKVMKL